MGKDLTVIKLGGSLLTDKSKPYAAREALMKNIAQEIKTCLDEGLIEDLVLVHGVGSFGHPPVLEYKLHKGYTGPEQFIPLSKTQRIVNEFRHLITKVFQEEGLPVNGVTAMMVTSPGMTTCTSSTTTKNGRFRFELFGERGASITVGSNGDTISNVKIADNGRHINAVWELRGQQYEAGKIVTLW